MLADVDGERKPRGQPRTHQPRRLRDISHLYISSRSAPRRGTPVAPRRRCLRLGFISSGDGRARADVCANMAVQLARLGQRTLVLDLDPHLPNAGFLLGLEPAAYMAHLLATGPRLERALLGLRVLEGLAMRPDEALSEESQSEIDASDCVLVNLPDEARGARVWLSNLEAALRHNRATTMVEAASRSPMFGSWLETARRGSSDTTPAPAASPHVLDALLFVHDRKQTDHLSGCFGRMSQWLPANRIHLLGWGEGQPPAGLHPWAWIQPYGACWQGQQLLSSLFPEHPASRTYQGLVQSLLAGAGSPGGMHV